jgi:uroporphyrinogen-III synthase
MDASLLVKGKVVAFLESRLADQMASLIARRGAIPMSAPALSEVTDVDPGAIRTLIDEWATRPVRLAIFQTGVGTRALFAATDALDLTTRFLELLEHTQVAVRGPKPTAALRGRGVRIDFRAAEPFTTAELLTAIAGFEVHDAAVLVQRYGNANPTLEDALIARGARVIDVPTYRWAPPTDVAPLRRMIDALKEGRVDAVVFTSASQVHNLFVIAAQFGNADRLRDDLNATCVASIGPVCSAALNAHGVTVQLEARPPKLGPLMAGLDAALQ